MEQKKADCGATFDHAGHLYKTKRGKIKACDGSIDKRTNSKTTPQKED